MTGPAASAVWNCLNAGGGTARFVGGSVRNVVMDLPVTDLDMATDLPPDRVMALAQAAKIRAIPTGIEHGTVTLVVDHVPIEVTTLRRDLETDGRRAVVAFTDDWTADAERRDFTLNALYLDPDGTLYDPTGDGLADARAGRLRFVGMPENRIREDALRILRLFRFLASHGRKDPDPEAVSACAELAPLIETLSGERVWAELRKLLAADGAASALKLMDQTDVIRHLWAGPVRTDRTLRLIELEAELGRPADPVRRLSALASGAAAIAAERLRLSNADRDRLERALAAEQPPASDEPARRAAIYRSGATVFVDRLLLSAANSISTEPQLLAEDLTVADDWAPPGFPIGGADALALGMKPGPKVGTVLRGVEEWWISGGFTADREACLSELKSRIEGDE
ncbi:MAG: CCA tRNA nucleotidyltransferase [Alphaproteobacteria bacterium]|nr:CCA tRNA nucleotidyltransferase [Alphaproteobacteria bacterium]